MEQVQMISGGSSPPSTTTSHDHELLINIVSCPDQSQPESCTAVEAISLPDMGDAARPGAGSVVDDDVANIATSAAGTEDDDEYVLVMYCTAEDDQLDTAYKYADASLHDVTPSDRPRPNKQLDPKVPAFNIPDSAAISCPLHRLHHPTPVHLWPPRSCTAPPPPHYYPCYYYGSSPGLAQLGAGYGPAQYRPQYGAQLYGRAAEYPNSPPSSLNYSLYHHHMNPRSYYNTVNHLNVDGAPHPYPHERPQCDSSAESAASNSDPPTYKVGSDSPAAAAAVNDSSNANNDVRGESSSTNIVTTLMIRNIPNNCSLQHLMEVLDRHCAADAGNDAAYDFLYLVMDFRTRRNKGYAFVNFTTPEAARLFRGAFHDLAWDAAFKSRKLCSISTATIQGLNALRERFSRSETDVVARGDFVPIFFHPPRDGTNAKQIQCFTLATVSPDYCWHRRTYHHFRRKPFGSPSLSKSSSMKDKELDRDVDQPSSKSDDESMKLNMMKSLEEKIGIRFNFPSGRLQKSP